MKNLSNISLLKPLARWIDSGASIVGVTEADRPQLLTHYLALPDDDRKCRFGVGCSDEAVTRYVDSIDLQRDRTFGVRDANGQFVAIAHVPLADGVAELGISVMPSARRRGLGYQLARRALAEARRAGAREFVFDFAAANEGMRRVAARLQMTLQRHGTELAARLLLARDGLGRAA